jgi:hypothetical protein
MGSCGSNASDADEAVETLLKHNGNGILFSEENTSDASLGYSASHTGWSSAVCVSLLAAKL